jgi:hypothetical protein
MATMQAERCSLERVGIRHALTVCKAKRRQSFKSPFDLVTKSHCYEVKALSAESKDLKIHISNSSFERKLEYANRTGKQPVLLAVLIYETGEAELYKSELRQSVRINQMAKI